MNVANACLRFLGASLPVSSSFAIAPLVFVFLHIYALVRYDMLAANVRL